MAIETALLERIDAWATPRFGEEKQTDAQREAERRELLAPVLEAATAAIRLGSPLCDREVVRCVGQLVRGATSDAVRTLLEYAGRHLYELLRVDTLPLERTLDADKWGVILRAASEDDLARVTSDWTAVAELRDETETLERYLEALASLHKSRPLTKTIVRAAVALVGRLEPSENVLALLDRLILPDVSGQLGEEQWLPWIAAALAAGNRFPDTDSFRSFTNALIVDDATAYGVLAGVDRYKLGYPSRSLKDVIRRVDAVAPMILARVIGRHWRSDLVHFDARAFEESSGYRALASEIAYPVAVAALKAEIDPERTAAVAAFVKAWRPPIPQAVKDEVTLMIPAWMQMLRWLEPPQRTWPDRPSAGAAAEAALSKFAAEHPTRFVAMARLMPYLFAGERLARYEALALLSTASELFIEQLIGFAAWHDEPKLRDWSRDVVTHAKRLSNSSTAVQASLVSALARTLDGSPVYPHPLEARSATWLCSPAVEASVRSAVQGAVRAFGLRRRQGLEEEQQTAQLIELLHTHLNGVSEVVRGMASAKMLPTKQPLLWTRQETKKHEAGKGVDAAIIVTTDIPGAFRFRGASLVQVKKQAVKNEKSGTLYDAWDIKVHQLLKELLPVTDSAVYWLLGPEDEMHVVPARLIAGLVRGVGQEGQVKARIDYGQVRSMSIPFDKYLVDLVLGGWLASSEAEVLEIAQGRSIRNTPETVLEVAFSFERPEWVTRQ